MFKVFEDIKVFTRIKQDPVVIDSDFCKIFYRVTCGMLFLFTGLITTTQLVQEKIACIPNDKDMTQYLNNYCFYNSTFIVPNSAYDNGIPYHGLGPYNTKEDDIRVLTYYQWLPWFLPFLAFLCYLPHAIWKILEGGILKKTVCGLEFAHLSFLEKELVSGQVSIPSQEQRTENLEVLRTFFVQRINTHKVWACKYIICEFLNIVLLFVQIFMTDAILGNQFISLGYNLYEFPDTALDQVFPCLAKCTFYKYGPSGTVEFHDILCLLPMNNVSSKLIPILWGWYCFLLFVSAMHVLFRLVCLCLHSQLRFGCVFLFIQDVKSIEVMTKKLGFADWLFLIYLAKNMDVVVFRELVTLIVKKMEEDDCVSDTTSTEDY